MVQTPLIRLFRPYISPDVLPALGHLFSPNSAGSVNIAQGEAVDRFEFALQGALGLPRPPIAVNSCTSALDLALHLAGVHRGDEVISSPMTCVATNTVIHNRGANVVWADVNPWTGMVEPAHVLSRIGRRTRAIMVVDWGGALSDCEPLYWARKPIIQDSAHSFLAGVYDNGFVPARGDYICWSFQAIKHLTCGDGGALFVPEKNDERARRLRWYGLDRTDKSDFRMGQRIEEAGYKYNMNDIAATIGMVNLKAAQYRVRSHQRTAEMYIERMKNSKIRVPNMTNPSSWLFFTLSVDNRKKFTAWMKENGIECSPVHARNDLNPCFGRKEKLNGVQYFAEHSVAIPCGWWLTEPDRTKIIEAVNSYA